MMAGYRPKSLDELNSIFDKTIAAEKAIKKSSSLLEQGEDIFSSFSSQEPSAKAEETAVITEERPSEEISDSVSDFIAKFSAQTETETVKEKPQMTVLFSEAPKIEPETEAEAFVQENETTAEKDAEKPSRDELFDEYARIMADDDDDAPSGKKLSRKEKKKLRKKEKAETKKAESQESEKDANGDDALPFDETAENEISETNTAEENITEENATEEEVSAEEKDDFDFPENYTPEWIKDGAESTEEAAHEKKNKKGEHALLKTLLSLVLVAVISVSALATVFKTVVPVNTGKLVADKYYVFTTYKDYDDLGLKENGLIITEKKYAEDGEVFAYVDYGSKTFEFGRRTDSITNEDGEVLYVTEKEGGRTLVSRDACKGVIYLTYDGRGKIVSLLTDNYVVIISASTVAALAIILVFVFALRKKKETDEKGEADNGEEFSEDEEDFEDIFSTIE